MQWVLKRCDETVDLEWRTALPFVSTSYIPMPFLVDESEVDDKSMPISERFAALLVADIYAAGFVVPEVEWQRQDWRVSPRKTSY